MSRLLSAYRRLCVSEGISAYVFAAAAVAVAIAVRLAVAQGAPDVTPFSTLFPAVVIAAAIAGWAAGAFALVLSAIAAWWLLPTAFSLRLDHPSELISLGLFLASGALVLLVTSVLREALAEATAMTASNAANADRLQAALTRNDALIEKLRIAMDVTGLATWDVDVIRDKHDWPLEFYELIGVPAHVPPDPEIFAALIHPADRQWVVQRYRGVYAPGGGETYDAEFRIQRFDTGDERWVVTRGRIIRNARGEAVRCIGAIQDVTRHKRAEIASRETNRRLRIALQAAALGVFEWNIETGEARWENERMFEIFGLAPDAPIPRLDEFEATILHPDDLATLRERMAAAMQPETPRFQMRCRIRRPSGALRWLDVSADCIFGPDQTPKRMVGIVADVTTLKQAEDQRQLVLGELSHRVKNVIATVQAIASLTFRREGSGAVQAFHERLAALGRVHDALIAGGRDQASLSAIVTATLGTFAPDDGASRLRGPDIQLPPRLAMVFAMALHELCTNAAKYGALSVPGGGVDVAVHLESAPEGRYVELVWTEFGGPQVTPPRRAGFGTSMILRVVDALAGGSYRVDFRPSGIVSTLRALLPDR